MEDAKLKTLRAAYQEHLDSDRTTLAYCVRIERADGVVHRFTSHARALTMSNATRYEVDAAGADATAVRQTSDLDADTFDLEGPLLAAGIARDDIAAGKFDNATVYLFRTNYADPVEDDERLAKGYWGRAELRDNRYVTEFRSLATLLEQSVGRVHSASCDADLGDSRCKVDLAPLTVSSTITAVTDQRTFTDTARTEADDYFAAGRLTVDSGANAGIAREVEAFSGGVFTLWQALPFPLAVDDAYSVYPGCRKRFAEDCQGKFDNAVNFQGFPHLPGTAATSRFGGQ